MNTRTTTEERTEVSRELIVRDFMIRVGHGELCPLCSTRIDDRGLCGCDAGGE